MDIVNAVAKARFGSAKAQRVQIHHSDRLHVDLICMEAGQQLRQEAGEWTYYVMAGSGAMTCQGNAQLLPTGQVAIAAEDEAHTLANAADKRLVVLAIGRVG